MSVRASARFNQEREGAQGLAGLQGDEGPRPPRPDAGAQGLDAGLQGDAAAGPRPPAGAQGEPAPLPVDAGEQGLPPPRRPAAWPGAQGEPAPQGLRAACAIWSGLAATGVAAAAVAATAAANVERLPAISADLSRLVSMNGVLSTGLDFQHFNLRDCLLVFIAVQLFGGQGPAEGALEPRAEGKAGDRDDEQ